MNCIEYPFDEVVTLFDKQRVPLSSMDRAKRQGKYRYYGAQGIIDYIDDYIFDGEYILLAEDGENLKSNKQNLAQLVDGKFWVNNHAHILRTKRICRLRYFYYWINSKNMTEYVTGSAQPKLSQSSLKKMVIPLPSLEVQDKILGAIIPIDEKIKENARINKNLEEQAKAILTHLLEVSEDSTLARLGDYLYIKGRIGWKGLKKSEYLNHSDYRIINGESLTTSGIDWDKTGYISKVRYDESPEIMLQIGDILLSKDGTIGKIGYVNQLDAPTSVASGIFVIRNTKPDIISTPFIYYLLKSSLFNSFVAGRTEGSVIPHLYQKDFKEFEFPLPSKKEMSTFDDLIGPQFEKFFANQVENEYLAKLRGTLLPKLMSGEIDVSALEF